MINFTPVLLCGGVGSRLWPLSRKEYPKQFLKIFKSDLSLFQMSLLRIANLRSNKVTFKDIIIVCNDSHRFLVLDQFEELNIKELKIHIILEPTSKNTAPAATIAALYIENNHLPSLMLVSPTDHEYSSNFKFKKLITQLLITSDDKSFLLAGVKALKPNNKYGHILGIKSDNEFFKVKNFVEKPNLTVSKKLINASDSNCFFNAGIFVFKSKLWIDAISKFEPKLSKNCLNVFSKLFKDNYFTKLNIADYKKLKSISIDYAVMEKLIFSKYNLFLLSIDKSGWKDMGSFEQLSSIFSTDKEGNNYQGNFCSDNAKNNLIFTDNQTIILSNVSNLNIIQTGNIILISDKNKSVDKKIYEYFNSAKAISKYPDLNDNIKEYRPWGWYRTLKKGHGYKIKEIQVNPGKSLSMQYHFHRSEHWVILEGTATVNVGKDIHILKKDQSFYIRKKQKHMLCNNHKKILKIVEIQSGDYLEEDDIVRLEDKYGRS